jgi:ATP-dependent DNA ligase
MKASGMTGARFGHVLDEAGRIRPDVFDREFNNDLWTMEQKFDGHRCLIDVEDGQVTTPLRSVTLPFHLTNELAYLPNGTYDGELVIPGGTATDVPNLALRDKLTYVLFDALTIYGTPLTDQPYRIRREALEQAFGLAAARAAREMPHIRIALPLRPEFRRVKELWNSGAEGVILKRWNSTYRPGYRSPDWVKVKKLESHAVTIVGFKPGLLGPHGITVIKFDDGTVSQIKTLDNGTLRAIAQDPDSYLGRRLVIQCQERTRSGSPRHPMWDHFAGDGE